MKHLYRSSAMTLGFGMLFLATNASLADAATAAPKTTVNRPHYTISLGTEMMNGDTTYQIGFPVTTPDGIVYDGYFPFSELEWPLDVWLARLDGSAIINDQWRINVTLKKDLNTPGDNMADSDWITDSNPDRLDIYSESEISSFDAFIMDADIEWTFMKRDAISLYAGLGYIYQNLDYEGELIRQYSPSGLSGYDAVGDGRVGITYEMIYSIPYLKVGTDIQVSPKFTVAGSLGYSPVVNAEDTDNHLLREFGGKINSGDMDGDAFMIDLSGRYMFTPALFLEAGFEYLKIDVDGTQTQVYGWGFPLGTVAEEAESTQTSGYVSLGFKF